MIPEYTAGHIKNKKRQALILVKYYIFSNKYPIPIVNFTET